MRDFGLLRVVLFCLSRPDQSCAGVMQAWEHCKRLDMVCAHFRSVVVFFDETQENGHNTEQIRENTHTHKHTHTQFAPNPHWTYPMLNTPQTAGPTKTGMLQRRSHTRLAWTKPAAQANA